MIFSIDRHNLHEDFLRERIYPALGQTRYWSPIWDPQLYIDLARAGFISISVEHPTHGAVGRMERLDPSHPGYRKALETTKGK